MDNPSSFRRQSSRTAWLGDDRCFWSLLAAVLGAISVLKGLRHPDAWALTLASLDYRDGFLKRALHGEVLHALGVRSAHALEIAMMLELAVLLVALAALLLHCGLTERTGDRRWLALFASSYAITNLSSLAGSTDVLTALLAVCLLLMRSPGVRFLLGLALVPAALLVSENSLLMWMPAVLGNFMLDAYAADSAGRRVLVMAEATVLALVAVAVCVVASLHAHLSEAQAAKMAAAMQTHVDFPVNTLAFRIMSFSMRTNFNMMIGAQFRSRVYWECHLFGLIVFAPLAVFLVWMISRLLDGELERGADRRTLHWLTLGLTLVLAAPVFLHALAWDQIRFDGEYVIHTMLVLAVVSRSLPLVRIPFSRAAQNLLLLVLVLGVASGWGLFNGAINPYPFYPAVAPNLRLH